MSGQGWKYAAAAIVLLAGCGDPLRDVDRLSDIETVSPPENARAITANVSTTQRPGFFGMLFGNSDQGQGGPRVPPQEDAVARALEDATREQPPEPTNAAAPPPSRAGGLFGGLFGGGAAARTEPITVRTPTRPGRVGNGPDSQQIASGEKLPFGEIARVCDLRRSDRGTKIGEAGGITLWDPFPNSTAPRPHYLTGFPDGCARSFTAALAMFGAADMHETTRYSASGPYDAVDQAYEDVKSRVCRARRGQPCGDKMPRLERQLAFVSAYDSFGNSTNSAAFLIHAGKVLAATRRDR
ncbi:MAG: hypothetical protein CSA72_11455 [Rhodobacterales bacterium]|nr:MAG: hypothetical protein CSA72_11455 [Rhodobacterales bacterium]